MIEKLRGKAGRESLDAPTPTGRAPRHAETASLSGRSFSEVLDKLGGQIDRGEALVKRAISGGHSGMDAGNLIALQAGIYRYTEAVDLAAKLVDRAGSAVKTTLQGSGG
ncbi:MAG: hypothetical protein IPI67_32470 [Myxococcales bacterium]|nr:hypothetical protein [Myxococcales bacterium]